MIFLLCIICEDTCVYGAHTDSLICVAFSQNYLMAKIGAHVDVSSVFVLSLHYITALMARTMEYVYNGALLFFVCF
jgi:hypothetical protein